VKFDERRAVMPTTTLRIEVDTVVVLALQSQPETGNKRSH
jgi:hypothetical protein